MGGRAIGAVVAAVLATASLAPWTADVAGAARSCRSSTLSRTQPGAVTMEVRTAPRCTAQHLDTASSPAFPIIGDFNGDGHSDVLVYRAGSGADHLWYGTATGVRAGPNISVSGNYLPAVGDFNGDGRDDVLWYSFGESSPSSVWLGAAASGGFHQGPAITPPADTSGDNYLPIPGDFDADGKSDLAWVDFGEGKVAGERDTGVVWYGGTHGFTAGGNFPSPACTTPSLTGCGEFICTTEAICSASAQDFNGDGRGDLMTYRSDGPETLAYSTGRGFHAGPQVTVNGFYLPEGADFNGDGHGDWLWYGFGTDPDHVWLGQAQGFRNGPAITVNGFYFFPISGDYNGDGKRDVVWYAAGSQADYLWYGSTTGFRSGPPISVGGSYWPTVGDFNNDGKSDILWLAQRGGSSYLWYGATSSFHHTGHAVALG